METQQKKYKADTKTRKWLLVINNPGDEYSHEKIKEKIKEFENIIYWCMSDEIGLEKGTPHTHIYVQSAHAIRFSTMKKRFPSAFFEMAKGSALENRNYIFKVGKWATDKKSETRIDGTQEEFGDIPKDEQGRRKDLEVLYDMVKAGSSDYEILESNPKNMMHFNKIERTREALREANFAKCRRLNLEVHYLWGDTETGKSRYVRDTYGDENVYTIDDYKHPFDNYNGEDVIVFEEFREDIALKKMLKYLDVYPLKLPARFHDKTACFTKVYIISNIPLEDQFKEDQRMEKKSWEAFIRRIHTITTFTKIDNTVDIKTKTMKEHLCEKETKDLPF